MRLFKKPLDYTGYLTVLVLWLSMTIAINMTGFSLFGTKPLSSLGVMPESDMYFSGGLIIAAILFMAFAIQLKNKFVINRAFLVAVALGQIGQIIAALAPYGGDQPARIIHTIAAFGLAFSIPIALFIFARAQSIGNFKTVVFALFLLELTAFIVGIGLFVLSIAAAYAQTLPAVAFHLWIIYVNKSYLEKA